MTWTDERIALLTDLWTAGKTGSECAEALGISRNAAIGKAYRLGLPARVQVSAEPRPKPEPKPRAPRPPKPAPLPSVSAEGGKRIAVRPNNLRVKKEGRKAEPGEKALPPAPPTPPKCHPVSLMAAGYGQCRFPVAEWAGPNESFFCGAPSLEGQPYCRWHQRIAAGGGTASERVAHQADKRVFA